MTIDVDVAEQFEKHLSSPKQTWLLGAGVSFPANIPLMYALTARVLAVARSELFHEDPAALRILAFIQDDCGANSHIEHHLTHLGDLISIAARSRTGGIMISGEHVSKDKLIEVHRGLIGEIAAAVRWGFKAARKDADGAITDPEVVGTNGKSIVDIVGHKQFISAVFGSNRAGLDFVRTPVEFFTTNYDTLIEDALALTGVEFQDGFVGGGVGFWNIRNYSATAGTRAIVSKLHGSIDWYQPSSGSPNMLRVRNGDTYPGEGGSVMIYPQATKYVNTQRDPFAEIFQRFRQRLSQGNDHVVLACGYSFGDDHINAEFEIAMASAKNQLTVVAFSDEPKDELPPTLRKWQSESWAQRLFIASPKGLYQGQKGPFFPAPDGTRSWWTFEGVSKLLSSGLPKDILEAMA
ncbi:SIR2 family protein [Agrobacterium sp. B1(2019)]|uniref:SIR2 family protein n=1 Tax=Agrobacterium sp. B1(2019) TaxID=2607032 RepID=UPI0011F0813B|nr:SIR2 family protein [Agrobacterium sp. B1(2019)]TZG36565.1 SIR2 family protein [Agrobacterium sp. B1(2019)]